MKILFVLFFGLYGTAALAEPWTTTFEGAGGVSAFLTALEQEEPGIVERCSRLGTNLVEVAENVPQLLHRLGENAAPLRVDEVYTALPSAFALFRHAYSIESPFAGSAYYALVQRTHTFVFERYGAAFVAEIDYEGRTIPYVVTLEGPGLTEPATQRALYAIARYFDVDTVALPERDRAYSFTDNELARRVFTDVETQSVELARLPEGWAKVDAWLAEKGETGTFFREASLRRARLAVLPESFRTSAEIEVRPERNFPSTPGRARVLLASQAAWRGWDREAAARYFRVPPENLLSATNVCRAATQAADEGP